MTTLLGLSFSIAAVPRAVARDGQNSGGGDENEANDEDSDNSENSRTSSAPINSTTRDHNAQPRLQNNGKLLSPDEVKTAISEGNAASLALLLAYVDINFPGQVLDVRLRQVDQTFTYEVKIISKLVFLRSLKLDAKTMKKL